MSVCPRTERAIELLDHTLSDDEAVDYAEHAAECTDCQRALAAGAIGLAVTRVHDPELFEDEPAAPEMPTSLVEMTHKPAPQQRPANNVRWFAGGLLVAAVAAMALVLLRPAPSPTDPHPRVIRTLGGGTDADPLPPRLGIRIVQGSSTSLPTAAPLSPTDQLQLEATPGAQVYLIDAQGFVPLVPRGVGLATARDLAVGAATAIAVTPRAEAPIQAEALLTGDPEAVLAGQLFTRHNLTVGKQP